MFSKGDQPLWLKIEVARGKNATECYRELVEACGTNPLPYSTVARWVQAFRSGRNETADLQRTGQSSIPQEQIGILSGLLNIDCRWTVRELSLEVGLSHQTVWHIMKKSLNMRKIPSRWVPNRLTEIQKAPVCTGWHPLGKITAIRRRFCSVLSPLREWARAYEPN
ncbi:uncharacterized protein LOC118188118 [Stegodyphus dumicola]|uniref:uncharacterized protein LOC118188118 n=1 Tax=Stegodyphus dumicola TaxID=202533 RepID=UPI0015AC2681|nr:uncharacterized protein LOC118188118 [Stegodyphus dumicola]